MSLIILKKQRRRADVSKTEKLSDLFEIKIFMGSYTNHVATKGGGGVPQKTTTLHNSYLVKVAALGGGGQNSEKNGYVVCVWPPKQNAHL